MANIDAKTWDQIADVVRQIIRSPNYTGATPPGVIPYRPPVMSGGGAGSARYAKAGIGGISARSGDILGSGTITLFNRSGSSLTLSSTTATCYNISAYAVAPDAYITVVKVGGAWSVVVESCEVPE